MCLKVLSLITGIWALVAIGSSACAADPLDFNRDVRPILSDKCFACHGPDAKHVEGDLRLDLFVDAIKPNDEGRTAIVPGKPEASEVVRRINAADASERMPPGASNKSLTAAEKEILSRWIAEGAKYQKHWAFLAPVRPEVPAVLSQSPKSLLRNPIDHFIADRLVASNWPSLPRPKRPR